MKTSANKQATDWPSDRQQIRQTLIEQFSAPELELIAHSLAPLRQPPEVVLAAMGLALVETGYPVGDIIPVFDDSTRHLFEESLSLTGEQAAWLQTEAKQASQTDNRLKLLLSILQDVRCVFVLLAAWLYRLAQAKGASSDEQQDLARLTFQAYAPLANRLGIGQLKWELEDFAFRYQSPEDYKSIARSLEEKRIHREQYIRDFVASVEDLLGEAGIEGKVYGRPKHIYSIWRKMQNKHLSFAELYDVRAIRIMVDSISDCYTVLGLVHARWPFIAGEYDDYIAAPKPNGYQSLHTAVTGDEDRVVEIQIRTTEMHEHAELGVAAHWRYKEGAQHASSTERQLERIRALLEEESEQDDTVEESEVYVLSPQGKVIELSAGSTPIDFAYRIHSDLGHRCRGAKVNGNMVPLNTVLHSGQRVEILTTRDGGPSRDWLIPSNGYVRSSRARSKIRSWFKQQFRDEHIQHGRTSLYRELDHLHIAHSELDAVLSRFNLTDQNDLFASVGRGELGVLQVINTLRQQRQVEQTPEHEPLKPLRSRRGSQDIVINGVDDLMSHLSRCCKPVPGDDIGGFITRGRGVAIHRRSCSNFHRLESEHPERIVDVHWAGEQGLYEVDIELEAMDRSGLLRDVSSVLSAEDVNLLAANTYSHRKTLEAHMRLTVEIRSPEKLNQILNRLIQLQGVLDVRRVR